MTVGDIQKKLDAHSPERCACGWDNVGLLVGDADMEVTRIYVALDATDEVIAHAIEQDCQMIVTHHPMIFSGLKRVVTSDFTGRRVMDLVSHGIALYAMHTNFDICKMAELAALKLGLSDTEPIEVTGEDEDGPVGIGRVGRLPQTLRLRAFAEEVRDVFGISHVRVFGDPVERVRRAAVCPGSGKSDIDAAIEKGADVYVTGDIDHHSGIDANMKGLCVIDAGHYGVEHIFIEYMRRYLESATEAEVFAEPFSEPFWIV